jgi:hypothetical protein
MKLEKTIQSFFKQYKIVPQQENARSFIFDCPSCGGHRKLYIQKEDGKSVCFKSGNPDKCPRPGSSIAYSLSLLSELSIVQVKKILFEDEVIIHDDLNVSLDETDKKQEIIQPINASELPLDNVAIGMHEFEEGKLYLNGRGINDEMIKKYQITYSPGMRRVIFPVIMNVQLYGWQGRAIDKVDKNYRMYNLPGPWKAKTLMFYDNIINKDFAILAEGPVSAIKFYKVGNFIASMGKEVSKAQLDLITNIGIKKLFLALDRDAFAKNEQIRYHLSNRNIQCFLVNVPRHRDDFGDSTLDECIQAFNNATTLDDALVSGDWDTEIITDKKEHYVNTRK